MLFNFGEYATPDLDVPVSRQKHAHARRRRLSIIREQIATLEEALR